MGWVTSGVFWLLCVVLAKVRFEMRNGGGLLAKPKISTLPMWMASPSSMRTHTSFWMILVGCVGLAAFILYSYSTTQKRVQPSGVFFFLDLPLLISVLVFLFFYIALLDIELQPGWVTSASVAVPSSSSSSEAGSKSSGGQAREKELPRRRLSSLGWFLLGKDQVPREETPRGHSARQHSDGSGGAKAALPRKSRSGTGDSASPRVSHSGGSLALDGKNGRESSTARSGRSVYTGGGSGRAEVASPNTTPTTSTLPGTKRGPGSATRPRRNRERRRSVSSGGSMRREGREESGGERRRRRSEGEEGDQRGGGKENLHDCQEDERVASVSPASRDACAFSTSSSAPCPPPPPRRLREEGHGLSRNRYIKLTGGDGTSEAAADSMEIPDIVPGPVQPWLWVPGSSEGGHQDERMREATQKDNTSSAGLQKQTKREGNDETEREMDEEVKSEEEEGERNRTEREEEDETRRKSREKSRRRR